MSVEEDGLRLEARCLLPQVLQRLALLGDPTVELRRSVLDDLHRRFRDRQEIRERFVERREVPAIQVAVLDQGDGSRIDRFPVPEDDPGLPVLIARDREVVQGGIQGIDLRVLEILDPRLLVDARSQADLLGVGTAEIQDGRKDADHLSLGPSYRGGEASSVEFERVDAGDRKDVLLSNLHRAILELLRGEDSDDLPFSTDDEISSAEDLEDHVKSVGTSFEAEDRDPIEALLLDRDQSSVIEQPPEGLCEGRRGSRLFFDLMEAEPAARLGIELDLSAIWDIDAEDDFVFSLIDLVDMAPDEALPLRDEDTEIEGGDGRLHPVLRKPVRYLMIGLKDRVRPKAVDTPK